MKTVFQITLINFTNNPQKEDCVFMSEAPVHNLQFATRHGTQITEQSAYILISQYNFVCLNPFFVITESPILKIANSGWRDDSLVKSTECSFVGLGFEFQYHTVVHNCLQFHFILFLASEGMAHKWWADPWRRNSIHFLKVTNLF